jgi:UDP-N-acetylglucosamine 1-carboxyvinyltransferase
MEKIVVEGGVALKGSVEISGSKNSSLPILAATALFGGEYKINNVPRISDVETMLKLLETLGAEVFFEKNSISIDTKKISKHEAPYDLVKTMRASVLVWGSLLGRFGRARVSFPGGCAIGDRPIDQHIKGFDALGYETNIGGGYLESVSTKRTGGNYKFTVKTVTGTENLILSSVLAKNKTTLYNCAVEPEVEDLINFLSSLGATINQKGGTIEISPATSLNPQSEPYSVIPDRIEAGTFLALGSVVGNEIEISNCEPRHLDEARKAIESVGSKVEKQGLSILKVSSPPTVSPTDIETNPHPLFPTDLQAQLMSVLVLANGVSKITENIFPNRFIHVAELRKLGAEISLKGNVATVCGVKELIGANMQASDLRASASLLIGALSAKGKSEVRRIYHLDRGYESIDNKLQGLGARIWREKE